MRACGGRSETSGEVAAIDVRVPRSEDRRWSYLALPGTDGGGRWAGFALARLEAGTALPLPASGLEAVVVPLRGGVRVTGPEGVVDLAGRADVWEGPTDIAFLPAQAAAGAYRLQTRDGAVEVAVGLAPAASGAGRPRRLPVEAVRLEHRGRDATAREIRHLYAADQPAQRLLVVEVVTPEGHWSSFPPHRHDGPEGMEEFYYCEVRPQSRHAYLHVFQEGAGRTSFDAPLRVRHEDLVLVREGYHMAACPPGATLYYLNVMAGARRAWAPEFHPAYRDLVIGWEGAPVAPGPARP